MLLPGTQTLPAFLIILPFYPGFARLQQAERWSYLAMFVCSSTSLVLFSAPAAQHRLEQPLRNPVRFKQIATQLIIGLVPLSLALVLATHLVVTEATGARAGIAAAAAVTLIMGGTWWLFPLLHQAGMTLPPDAAKTDMTQPATEQKGMKE